jgi:pyruvate formate lyase activating enzyme
MKEAILYEKINSKVRCNLCYRRCIIGDRKTGFCGVRKNINGKLYSLVYGRVASYSCNPIEKKPFFHFYPGSTSFSFSTVGCNFKCLHCQNWEISHAKPQSVVEFDFTPELIIKTAKDYGCEGISYTFTEPTVFFEYCYDTGKLAKEADLNNNFVTNGYETPETVKLASEFLDAARIDLKGDEKHYKKVCGEVKLENVLECIKNFYKTGMHIEIITLVIPNDNDKKDLVCMFADFLKSLSKDIPWHFTRFYPAHKMLDVEPTPIKTLEKMHDWAKELGMRYVYIGNVPGHKYENTYCANCDNLLIQRFSFSITKINLSKNNKCPNCNEKIPIVGEAKVTSSLWPFT